MQRVARLRKSITRVMSCATAVILAGCGQPGDSDVADERAGEASAKFEGSRIAPPSDTMSYLLGKHTIRDKTNRHATGCSFTSAKPGSDCAALLETSAQASVFTPEACREGDERSDPVGALRLPVSCDGLVETPFGSARFTATFHRPGGGEDAPWELAMWPNYVSGSWTPQ